MWVGDLEANGLLNEVTTIHCGVFKNTETGEVVKFTPEDIHKLPPFLDTVEHLCMHNGIGYDMPLLKKIMGYEFKGELTDTLILSRLYDPKRMRPFGLQGKSGPHSVDAWGYRLGRGKPEHEDWSVYSPEMLHRCSEDVEIQHMIFQALEREAEGFEWKRAARLNHKLFTILQKQKEFGWLTDREQMDRCLYFLEKWMNTLHSTITPILPSVIEVKESKKAGVYSFHKAPFLKSGKINSHLQKYWGEDSGLVGGPHTRVLFRPVSMDKNAEVKDYLLSVGWIPAVWNVSKKTGETTGPKLNSDDPFEGVESKIGKSLARYVVFKDRQSTIRGWIERTREDGRLESLVSGLAATGRARHANIANVPNVDTFFGKWMRKCFTAPEGRVLIGCDAGSCQDRMLANRAQNPEFTDMLINGDKSKGTDGHSLAQKAVNTVASMFNLTAISRGVAKGFNFAWKFGASDPKLGSMLQGGKEVGEEIRVQLANVFPAQAELLEELTAEWRSHATASKGKWGDTRYKDGWIRGLDGRPIHISSEHMILVYMLQSDEAVCMAGAYCLLYNRLIKKGYKWGEDWAYVCWYHDEYTIECSEGLAEEIKKEAEAAIADAGKIFGLTHCPQIGDAEVGKNWYDIH